MRFIVNIGNNDQYRVLKKEIQKILADIIYLWERVFFQYNS